MKMLRDQTITRIFSLFTGVIFLNMGFFLAEVSMLDLRDGRMVENVCKLVLNGGLEEEREAHSSAADTTMKIFGPATEDLALRHSSLFLIASKTHQECEDPYLHADHSEKFSPPPESVSSHS